MPDAERTLFRRMAFITRYTANSLEEAMRIPVRDLPPYEDAIAELIEQENKIAPSATGR